MPPRLGLLSAQHAPRGRLPQAKGREFVNGALVGRPQMIAAQDVSPALLERIWKFLTMAGPMSAQPARLGRFLAGGYARTVRRSWTMNAWSVQIMQPAQIAETHGRGRDGARHAPVAQPRMMLKDNVTPAILDGMLGQATLPALPAVPGRQALHQPLRVA